MRTIPEADWKKLRAIRDLALNRFCARILKELKSEIEAAELATDSHKAYLDVYAHMEKRDEELGNLFNDWRRSTALATVISWARSGVLTEGELESLSEDTKKVPRGIGDIEFFEE